MRLPASLPGGKHRVEVKLISSTFNFFGPPHHVVGEPHVVSPGQYAYAENFADRWDAPENTRTKFWHLKSFGIGSRLEFWTLD